MTLAIAHPALENTRSPIDNFHEAAHDWFSFAARRMWYGSRRLWWHSYWDLKVEGAEHVPARGPVILCANHGSHLDAPAILAALPRALALRVSTAAARDVFGAHSLKGALSRMMTNSMPIDRTGEFAGGLRTLEKVLKEHRPLILFPEGRRSPDGRMLPFKCGAAMLALRTGAPIVPIHLYGLHELLPRGRRVPLPGEVRVRFGEPINPRRYQRAIADGKMSRREAYGILTEELRAAVVELGHNIPTVHSENDVRLR